MRFVFKQLLYLKPKYEVKALLLGCVEVLRQLSRVAARTTEEIEKKSRPAIVRSLLDRSFPVRQPNSQTRSSSVLAFRGWHTRRFMHRASLNLHWHAWSRFETRPPGVCRVCGFALRSCIVHKFQSSPMRRATLLVPHYPSPGQTLSCIFPLNEAPFPSTFRERETASFEEPLEQSRASSSNQPPFFIRSPRASSLLTATHARKLNDSRSFLQSITGIAKLQ